MIEERPPGSLNLLECLAEDPFGTVHRGLEWTGPRTTRAVLVRQYHPAWVDPGLATRRHEILRNLVHLGNLNPYKGCHTSRDGSLRLLWPYAPGRSLAQTLRAAEAQGIPFGFDQALFLVWALSHHIRHLHQVQLSTGILMPHRIWIGFDGWVQLLDVPVMGILTDAIPARPDVEKQLAPYLQGPRSAGVEFNAFQLGVLLFEMLTHRPLPVAQDFASILKETTVAMPHGEVAPIPEAIAQLLERLLGCCEPFRTLEDLERNLEESLFGGAYDPSTFGLAFAMQTLFRQELNTSEMASEPALQEEAAPLKEPPLPAKPPRASWRRLLAASILLATGGVAWVWTPAQPLAAPAAPPPLSHPVAQVPEMPLTAALPVAPAAVTSVVKAPTGSPIPLGVPEAGSPVRLRVFVDEIGRVRQAHLLSGAEEGSARERAACVAAMQKNFPSPGKVRTWQEITVLVP